MKGFLLSSLLLPLALGAVVPKAEEKIDYTGYKTIRVTIPEDSAEIQQQIEEVAIHILNPEHRDHLDIVVAPENLESFNALGFESEILDEDLGSSLAEEGPLESYDGGDISVAAVPSATWFTAYHAYADHNTFLTDLQSSFPANSELITAGTSVQGRVINGIHIWGSGGKGSKPAVLFHGNVHAREWITSKTAQYTAYQLLTQYSSNAAIKAVVDKFDFYILPIVNPDGFVYTQTNDRLWRKNRQTVSTSTCVGRDINRNWPYKWELTNGASTSPCAETYKGLAAGDAPENKGLVDLVTKLKASNGIRLYIDFHSYGQYILWGYGYDCSARPENNAALNTLATTIRSSLSAVSGTSYTIGPSCSTLYATTGSSVDYLDVVGNATYSYTIELRDTGRYGFQLPAAQIQPTVVETWAGVLAGLQTI